MPDESELSFLSLSEALQDVFVHQRSGRLRVRQSARRERLVFLSGQLYLAGDNPLHDRLQMLLAAPDAIDERAGFDPRQYLERSLHPLVLELADQLDGWGDQDVRFDAAENDMPDDLVGPVPTGLLVMELCCRGLEDRQLIGHLGGLDARYRASEELMLRRRVPELTGDEVRLLDRLDQAASLRTLLAEAGGPDPALMRRLARLSAVRLVVSDGEEEFSRRLLTAGLLSDISQRIVASLERQPLDLERSAHRAQIETLLGVYGRQNYYELLDVDAESPVEEIHAQFMRLARTSHPSHARRLGGKGLERRLDWLFARLTEAYLILSDPDRAAEYRRGWSELPERKTGAREASLRRSERSAMARESYRLAQEHESLGDYHSAIELLRQAVQLDPLPDYFMLLGRCQCQNPQWLHMAVDSFRAAAALEPHNESIRSELSETIKEYRERQRNLQERGREEADMEPEASGGFGLARRLAARLRGRSEPSGEPD